MREIRVNKTSPLPDKMWRRPEQLLKMAQDSKIPGGL